MTLLVPFSIGLSFSLLVIDLLASLLVGSWLGNLLDC